MPSIDARKVAAVIRFARENPDLVARVHPAIGTGLRVARAARTINTFATAANTPKGDTVSNADDYTLAEVTRAHTDLAAAVGIDRNDPADPLRHLSLSDVTRLVIDRADRVGVIPASSAEASFEKIDLPYVDVDTTAPDHDQLRQIATYFDRYGRRGPANALRRIADVVEHGIDARLAAARSEARAVATRVRARASQIISDLDL